MRLLRFLFTGRRSFVLFAFLSFVLTLGYMAWHHRHRTPVLVQPGRTINELRSIHRDADRAIRKYKGPDAPPPAKLLSSPNGARP